MVEFEREYGLWIEKSLQQEMNSRRKERLSGGLGHGTVEFLRKIWFPAVGSFRNLHAEWEVRDMAGGYRYIDLAYLPESGKRGAFEIQGYGPHARDLDVRRFKDLCWRHSLLALDDWIVLPIAYPSILQEPNRVHQLVLAFIGKFFAMDIPEPLPWLEAETIRYASRVMRPVDALELSAHLSVSRQYASRLLQQLVQRGWLQLAGGKHRYGMFSLSHARCLNVYEEGRSPSSKRADT